MLIGMLGLSAPHASAAGAAGQFNVTVTVQSLEVSQQGQTGFCIRFQATATGSDTVTFVCATGLVVDIQPPKTGQPWVPSLSGVYSLTTRASDNKAGVPSIAGYTGSGTTTSGRMVRSEPSLSSVLDSLPPTAAGPDQQSSPTQREVLEMLVEW